MRWLIPTLFTLLVVGAAQAQQTHDVALEANGELVAVPILGSTTGPISFAPPQPVQPPNVLVEGHVFSKRSGKPLANALVQSVWPSGHPPPYVLFESDGAIERSDESLTIVGDPGGLTFLPISFAITDENGFYSMVVNQQLYRGVSARCWWDTLDGERLALEQTSSLPHAEAQVIRRDFHVETPRRLMQCQGVRYPLYQFPVELDSLEAGGD